MEAKFLKKGTWYYDNEGIYEYLKEGNDYIFVEIIFDEGDEFHYGKEFVLKRNEVKRLIEM